MKTHHLTRVALMLALLIVSAQLAIPIGPVAVTLQTLVVLIIGLVLPKKQALLTMILYLFAGIMGLPIFAQAMGGPHSVFLPSFGFVLSFIPAVYLMAKKMEKSPKKDLKSYIYAVILGSLVIYAIGISYMSFILLVHLGNDFSLWKILSIGMIPFIPGDLLKSFLAVTISMRLNHHLKDKF